MQAVANPTALELSKEAKKAVEPNELVNSALDRTSELRQLCDYFFDQAQKTAQKAAQEAAQITEQKWKEEMLKMLILALKSNAAPNVIEAMQKGAGITDSRLAELRKQAQP